MLKGDVAKIAKDAKEAVMLAAGLRGGGDAAADVKKLEQVRGAQALGRVRGACALRCARRALPQAASSASAQLLLAQPLPHARAQYKEEAQQLEQQLVEEKAKNQRQIEEDMAHVKKLWQE